MIPKQKLEDYIKMLIAARESHYELMNNNLKVGHNTGFLMEQYYAQSLTVTIEQLTEILEEAQKTPKDNRVVYVELISNNHSKTPLLGIAEKNGSGTMISETSGAGRLLFKYKVKVEDLLEAIKNHAWEEGGDGNERN